MEDIGPVRGLRVLVRVDFSVPTRDGEVLDDRRIVAVAPTLEWLVRRGASVTLATHFGSAAAAAPGDIGFESVARLVGQQYPGVVLHDNLRLDPREAANDRSFAEELVANHDAFVNDAFATAHREHASIMWPPILVPGAAGRLFEVEQAALDAVMEEPPRPVALVVGGAKVDDKLALLRALAPRVDDVLVGGATGNVFAAVEGRLDSSSVARDHLESAAAALADRPIETPADFVLRERRGPIVDIGPRTAERFSRIVSAARTLIWSGPLGIYELQVGQSGTRAVASAISPTCRAVAGGGDTVAALGRLGLTSKFAHVSTGGGAMLHYLLNRELPAITALRSGLLAQTRNGARA